MPHQPDVEIEDVQEDDLDILPDRYTVTSYGADFLVDGLVRRLQDGDIYVPPWQRGYVWTRPQASRFIESLLWGLPVPGIFLAKERDSQKLVVVDGQQRLRTLEFFTRGVFSPDGREFSLDGVLARFNGKTHRALEEADRRTLADSVVHATIFRQDAPDDSGSCTYEIFRRLNTGGTALSSQEVRSVQYHGEFIDLLEELNKHTEWRRLFGPTDRRKRDQELILRFFALLNNGTRYEKPMKSFLNTYAGCQRHITVQRSEELASIFDRTMSAIIAGIGQTAFRSDSGKLNAAVFDAVSVGVANRLTSRALQTPSALEPAHAALMRNADFTRYTHSSTSDEIPVKGRIALAVEAFQDTP